ncbi:MAG: hypothetical protein V4696_00905, partial [Pseudomonadota bacterium]
RSNAIVLPPVTFAANIMKANKVIDAMTKAASIPVSIDGFGIGLGTVGRIDMSLGWRGTVSGPPESIGNATLGYLVHPQMNIRLPTCWCARLKGTAR